VSLILRTKYEEKFLLSFELGLKTVFSKVVKPALNFMHVYNFIAYQQFILAELHSASNFSDLNHITLLSPLITY